MEIENIIFTPKIWSYYTTSEGESAICLRATHYKEVKYFPTGYYMTEASWIVDEEEVEGGCPFRNHPDFNEIKKKINSVIDDVKYELRTAKEDGYETITLTEIKKRIKNRSKRSFTPKTFKILAYFDTIITQLENEGKVGYADVFTNCKNLLKKIIPDDCSFIKFDKECSQKLEKYLRGNIQSNGAISVYLRTFYRLWNLAIEAKICPADHHPKEFITFKAYKKYKTKKKAVKYNYIQSIESLECDYTSFKFRAQKWMLFCYYARGMNFGDMAKLKFTNINGTTLKYRRSKNGRPYEFRLHPKALEIIELFKSYPLQSDAGYIFPILNKQQDTPKKIKNRIHDVLGDVNIAFEEISKEINSPKKITSNAMRHSVATNLRDKGVKISVIKEILGHEVDTETEVYLDSIDDDTVAEQFEFALS